MRDLTFEEIDLVSGASPSGCMVAIGGVAITAVGFEFGPADWALFGFALYGMYDSCKAP